jgi:hypothetical protein
MIYRAHWFDAPVFDEGEDEYFCSPSCALEAGIDADLIEEVPDMPATGVTAHCRCGLILWRPGDQRSAGEGAAGRADG